MSKGSVRVNSMIITPAGVATEYDMIRMGSEKNCVRMNRLLLYRSHVQSYKTVLKLF